MKSEHWTEDEDKKLFQLFKKLGTRWSMIIKYFDDRSENDVKNRFYSTLRRVATKKRREDPELLNMNPNSKTDLVKYVDDALHYGHDCFSKRGRMRRDLIERLKKDSIAQKVFDPELPKPFKGALFDPFSQSRNNLGKLVIPVSAGTEQLELGQYLFKSNIFSAFDLTMTDVINNETFNKEVVTLLPFMNVNQRLLVKPN